MSYGRRPPNTDGMISLKVDNLTYRTTADMLKRVFEKYGEVGDVYIPRDPYKQESRGFAFVRFYDDRDAEVFLFYLPPYRIGLGLGLGCGSKKNLCSSDRLVIIRTCNL